MFGNKSLNTLPRAVAVLTQSTVTTEYYHNTELEAKPLKVMQGSTELTEGTLGSLTADQWAFGDNDGLGYNTLYVYGNSETTYTGLIQIAEALPDFSGGESYIIDMQVTSREAEDMQGLIAFANSLGVVYHTISMTVAADTDTAAQSSKMFLNPSDKVYVLSSHEDVSVFLAGDNLI